MLTLWQVLLSGERSGVPKDSASDGQEQPWTLQDLEPLQPSGPQGMPAHTWHNAGQLWTWP